nr:hypothetical protein [Pedobacter sp. ASV2]
MKIKLEKPELISLLKVELKEIEALCVLYDSGKVDAIHDMAKAIVKVFHNNENSKSLLSQLKLTHLPVYCSADTYNPKSLINYLGLLKLEHKIELGWNYYPKLEHVALKPVSQDNWWQNKKIVVDSLGIPYSRAKIIKLVSTNASDLEKMDTSGWKIKGEKEIKINPIPGTIRQIAYELLESFKDTDLNKESKLHYKV